jgi:DNA-binding FrmR family transcriptional regulator
MRKDIKAATLKRLSRIEGQVRGVIRMIEDERYCIDVLTQTQAIRGKKAAELIELLERAAR